jgi:hypothetical protein
MDLSRQGIKDLVLVPALITLVVTVLRLAGELFGWSTVWFNPEAGGGGSPIGIVWLVPVFGIYFAWKLAKSGQASVSAGRAVGFALLGIAIFVVSAGIIMTFASQPTDPWVVIVTSLISLVAAYVVTRGWRELCSTLLIYGLAARIPVVIIMFFAILGNWGTHYDVMPNPDFPAMGWFMKWLTIGLFPQLTFWIAFTITVGGLFGGITLALVKHNSN